MASASISAGAIARHSQPEEDRRCTTARGVASGPTVSRAFNIEYSFGIRGTRFRDARLDRLLSADGVHGFVQLLQVAGVGMADGVGLEAAQRATQQRGVPRRRVLE